MNKKEQKNYRKKFIKQYGDLTVILDSISAQGGICFNGVEVPSVFCNLDGDLDRLYYPFFVDTEYTLKYLLKRFSHFRISIFIDTSLPYYIFEPTPAASPD